MPRERYTPQEQEFYKNYLQSKAWKIRKNSRIRLANNQCEWIVDLFNSKPIRCERTKFLCVHHNTYERLGNELDTDLTVLCIKHHLLEHLLWQKCCLCHQVPCLGDEVQGEKWLDIVLYSEGIDLDSDTLKWNMIPNKEHYMAMLPKLCPGCYNNLKREE